MCNICHFKTHNVEIQGLSLSRLVLPLPFLFPFSFLGFLPGASGAAAAAVNPSRRGVAAPCRSSNPRTARQTSPWGQEVTWRLTIPVHGIALTILWEPPAPRTAVTDAQKTTGCIMAAGHRESTQPAPAWRPQQLCYFRGRDTRTRLQANVAPDFHYSRCIRTCWRSADLTQCSNNFWLL